MSGARAFEIAVVVRSPFLFQGIEVAGVGFDSSAQRDELGRPIIPGDHLRGHLRHALMALLGADAQDHCKRLFGEESPEASNDARERGALLLGDLHHDGAARQVSSYTRIALMEKTGAVQEGSLQQIELVAPIGEEVCFRGRLVLRPKAPADAAQKLLTALQMIPALGANKSAGFGEVVSERCELRPLAEPPLITLPNQAGRYAVTVRFDRPLLVNADRLDNNVFRSAKIVPGGAIKGALAQALTDAGQDALLDEEFSNILIGHAFPLQDGMPADRAMPDLMIEAEGKIRFGHEPRVLEELSLTGVPSFPGDWKDAAWAQAQRMLGRPAFDHGFLPRGRVAVTPDGIAEEGKLFVVMPVATAGHRWRFILDMSDRPSTLCAAVSRELSAGLDGLGRTGARMIVEKIASISPPAQPAAGEVLLLLETPAALTDLRNGAPLFEQYAAYMHEVLGAKLLGCWARQRMAGHYQAIRHRAFGAASYLPFELTEAGAVFHLEVTETTKLGHALRRGLPPFDAKLTWDTCPFMAENGYGEVSVLDPGLVT